MKTIIFWCSISLLVPRYTAAAACFGVIEGLRALRPEARFLELVHRLDRDTSGVLLVAKSAQRCVRCTSNCAIKACRKIIWRWCAASGSRIPKWSVPRC